MLVVISDLHLEEEKSRNIYGNGSHPPIVVPRNIHVKAFTKIIGRLNEQAQRDGAQKMDLVLAGDIFELHRTALWFQNNPHDVRPYMTMALQNPNLEAKILEILAAINAPDGRVHAILAAFRRLVQDGSYIDENGQERKFAVPVQLYYIPGNHDRLANFSPTVRRRIRELLGLPPIAADFQHFLSFKEERTLIRHGHEYDVFNFSEDYREVDPLKTHLPEIVYAQAPFGDFITVDVVARISELFRAYHGDDQILASDLLRTVYERILEFDDLRPMRAVLNFLLHMPNSGFSPAEIWNGAVEPVVLELLDTLYNHPFLHKWLDKLDQKWTPDVIDAVQAVLALRAWRWGGVSLQSLEFLSNLSIRAYQSESGPEILAAREESIGRGEHSFVVAGHTHKPAVELIGHRDIGEQYYVNTGTWRRRLPATPDFRFFGRIKTVTYVVIYGPNEDPAHPTHPGKIASLDYWTGATERWIR